MCIVHQVLQLQYVVACLNYIVTHTHTHSLRYFLLHPKYLTHRVSHLRATSFACKICLTLVDVEDNNNAIKQITKLCIHNNLTLILAWSNAEAGIVIDWCCLACCSTEISTLPLQQHGISKPTKPTRASLQISFRARSRMGFVPRYRIDTPALHCSVITMLLSL
jgi:DNA repair protein Rad10